MSPRSVGESWASGTLVIPLLDSRGSLASGLLTGDNSRLWGELASGSAVGDSCSSESELVGDSSSLLREGGGHIVECLHLGPSVEAAQGCLIIGDGQLGLSMHVDAVEQVLWGELLLDSLIESLDIGDDSVGAL